MKKPIFILFLLLSRADSYEQNEEDIAPPPTPQTNTLYTSMQWETSSPAEEGMNPDLLETSRRAFPAMGITERNTEQKSAASAR